MIRCIDKCSCCCFCYKISVKTSCTFLNRIHFLLIHLFWDFWTLVCWSNIRVRTPLIASPTFIIQKLKDFSRSFGIPGLQVLMHSFSRGRTRIVCLLPTFLSFVKPLSTSIEIPPLADWPSSAFWPLLWGHYKNAIVTFSRHKGKNIHGRNVNSIFGSPNWEGRVYTIRLTFR